LRTVCVVETPGVRPGAALRRGGATATPASLDDAVPAARGHVPAVVVVSRSHSELDLTTAVRASVPPGDRVPMATEKQGAAAVADARRRRG